MKQKPITKRERALMKIAFEAGRKIDSVHSDDVTFCYDSIKYFLKKDNYVPGKIVIDFYSVRFLKR